MHAMHEVPLWVKLSPRRRDADRPVHRLAAPISATPTIPRRFVGQFGVLYRFLLNKWYFDELYDLLFVRPAFVARPPVLEAGRRGHDRPLRPRRRRRRWSVGGNRAHRAAAVGLCLYLRAGDAARPRRRRHLGDGAMNAIGFPILSLMLAVPLLGGDRLPVRRAPNGARWIALVATLVDLALGILPVGQLTTSAAPQWQFVEHVPAVRPLRLGARHRRHRADADHAHRLPDADLHRRQLERDRQARARIYGRLPAHGDADDRRVRGAGPASCSTSSSRPA